MPSTPWKRRERTNVLGRNILGSIVLKVLSLLVAMASIPSYLRFLGDGPILGGWFTILTLANWLTLFDFGLGNGLRNALALDFARGDIAAARARVSSVYFGTGGVTILILLVALPLVRMVDWARVFGLLPGQIESALLNRSMAIVIGGLVLYQFLRLVTFILYAQQRNVLVAALPVISNLLLLLFLRAAPGGMDVSFRVFLLALVLTFANCVPLVVVTGVLFSGKLARIRPHWRFCSARLTKGLMRTGGAFLSIQLSIVVLTATDQWLVTWLYGAEWVVPYQVHYRVLGLASMLFLLVTQPTWSAVSVAWAKRDIPWIRGALRKLFIAAAAGSICVLAAVPCLPFAFRWWLKGAVSADAVAGALFALLVSAEMFMYAGTCVANGIGHLRCQVFCTVGGAILKLPVTYALALYSHSWKIVVLGHLLSLMPQVLGQPFALKRTLSAPEGVGQRAALI